MRVTVLLHRTAELDDWPEKVRSSLEEKVSPLEVEVKIVPTCFDLAFEEPDGDVTVAVVAPKKGMGGAVSPVVDALLKKGIRVFFGWYDDMPSMLEDFVAYLYELLGVKE